MNEGSIKSKTSKGFLSILWVKLLFVNTVLWVGGDTIKRENKMWKALTRRRKYNYLQMIWLYMEQPSKSTKKLPEVIREVLIIWVV